MCLEGGKYWCFCHGTMSPSREGHGVSGDHSWVRPAAAENQVGRPRRETPLPPYPLHLSLRNVQEFPGGDWQNRRPGGLKPSSLNILLDLNTKTYTPVGGGQTGSSGARGPFAHLGGWEGSDLTLSSSPPYPLHTLTPLYPLSW